MPNVLWPKGYRGLEHSGFRGALILGLLSAAPVTAQVNLPPMVFQPPTAGTVVNDPNRVYGDDAPVFAGLGVLGAMGLNFNADLNTSYRDNVANVPTGGTLSPRFQSKDDWIFRPSVGVHADREFGRARVFASGSLGRTIYASNSQLNSNRMSLGGGVAMPIGRPCNATLRMGWSKRDTQSGQFDEVVPATQDSRTFNGGLSCQTLGGLVGSASYSQGSVRNQPLEYGDIEADRSYADVRTKQVSGSLGYSLTQRGQVGVQASWSENIYPNQVLLTGETNGNKVRSMAVYGSYRVGNSIMATASLGKTNLSSSVPGSTDFSGSTWNVGLSYGGRRLGANLSAGRGVNGGSGGQANYSISSNIGGSATYRLNDRMSVATGYSWGRSDYEGSSEFPVTGAINQRTSNQFFVGADYSLNRLLSFGLDYNHSNRSSSPSGFSYKVNTISLAARARF